MLKTQKIEYNDKDTLLEGYYAADENQMGKKPIVLVVHDWSGRNHFADQKAEKLAELGYIGFAIDMYGEGKIGKTDDEKIALMSPLKNDRQALRQRILSAFDKAKSLPNADSEKVGVIGFCFGGLCALDLLRSGAALKAVVSFHGLLMAPENLSSEKMQGSVLALHGHNDPMVPPEQVLAFETEMTAANVDWQLHAFGQTSHAFMNPLANNPASGLIYNAKTEKRAWGVMESFLREMLV